MNTKLVKLFITFLLINISFFTIALPKQKTIGEWNNELLIRSERTTDLPNDREDLERTQITLWMELTAPINKNFSFGVSVRGNKSSDDPANNLINLDNSESNTFELDQSFLDWNMSDTGFLRMGKQYLPTKLSTMVWDKDLSVSGGVFSNRWFDDSDNEYDFAFGSGKINHLFNDEVKISFLNFHYTTPIASSFFTVGGSAIKLTETDTLINGEFNLRRTNNDAALLEEFEVAILDLNFTFDLFDQAIEFGIEAGQNFALEENNQMTRVNLIIGDNQIKKGWQMNVHFQDIEQDAVVAAFN
ncbi:MAG: hypothetical protein ACPGJI_07675, partial [Kangiellaceae bacterium]